MLFAVAWNRAAQFFGEKKSAVPTKRRMGKRKSKRRSGPLFPFFSGDCGTTAPRPERPFSDYGWRPPIQTRAAFLCGLRKSNYSAAIRHGRLLAEPAHFVVLRWCVATGAANWMGRKLSLNCLDLAPSRVPGDCAGRRRSVPWPNTRYRTRQCLRNRSNLSRSSAKKRRS